MGQDSHIEWTNHTFNPWWGCAKVSAACKNCYAETWAKRMGKKLWGEGSARWFYGQSHWDEPLEWNAAAAEAGTRARVFCASMSDVFEDRRDLDPYRKRLWKLITDTPNLDWLLLTKRPEEVNGMVPWGKNWPENVWLGTSVEDQENAEKRIPILIESPARIRFLSCEPLLGPVNLSEWIKPGKPSPIHWVIVGGESGAKNKCRPTRPEWVQALRDFTAAHKIAYHFKQWGSWVPDQT